MENNNIWYRTYYGANTDIEEINIIKETKYKLIVRLKYDKRIVNKKSDAMSHFKTLKEAYKDKLKDFDILIMNHEKRLKYMKEKKDEFINKYKDKI